MTFVPVNELPQTMVKTHCKRKADHLKEFLMMGVKYAKMEFNQFDYAYPYSAYAATKALAKFYGLPIDVKCINEEVYLINRELEEPKNENT